MTPAEKMAQRLEGDAYSLPSTWKVGDSPEWDHVNSCTEAAAMIRRLAAALIEFREAYENGGFVKHGIMERHADALRDAKEEA